MPSFGPPEKRSLLAARACGPVRARAHARAAKRVAVVKCSSEFFFFFPEIGAGGGGRNGAWRRS